MITLMVRLVSWIGQEFHASSKAVLYMSIILITGASSGIGYATALYLSARGHTVFGTSRKPKPNLKLPFTMLELDVNSDASVETCIKQVIQKAGSLEILINNAGYDLYGSAEETADNELRDQLETNFFGAVRLSKALVPYMRERRYGKIIQISSVGGLFALPYNSAYAASKFALEGYSEALRYELLPFNVFVSLIEPGQVNTETLETSMRLTALKLPAYQNSASHAVNKIRLEAQKTGLNVESVVRSITRAVETPKPKLRYAVGGIARFLPVFKLLMPGAFESMMLGRFQPLQNQTIKKLEVNT
jgi:short-subunit dehydrogenase